MMLSTKMALCLFVYGNTVLRSVSFVFKNADFISYHIA